MLQETADQPDCTGWGPNDRLCTPPPPPCRLVKKEKAEVILNIQRALSHYSREFYPWGSW